MYAVVGCNRCGTMWLLSDPETNETARCPRCERTHRTKRLKHFFESADRSAAREARSALLAKKRGDSEAFAEVEHVSELENRIDESGVDDREYLEGFGLDADAIEAAGERSSRDRSGASGGSRMDVVREAIDALEEPTEAAIVSYAAADGVPAESARDLLEKLRRRGEVSESQGTYRRL
ncbi:DUF5817 domain-containing protein [Halopenitus sp. H-Gu1]|uniref:DUF5817 domain-containing protein n=1 Tax=Halopenitus sp. H-Gu1 TaxID=3242697 RepID=UPI00359EA5BE